MLAQIYIYAEAQALPCEGALALVRQTLPQGHAHALETSLKDFTCRITLGIFDITGRRLAKRWHLFSELYDTSGLFCQMWSINHHVYADAAN